VSDWIPVEPVDDYHSWAKPAPDACPDCECCSKRLCENARANDRAGRFDGACHLLGTSADFDLSQCPCWRKDRPAAPRVAAQGEAGDVGTSPAAGVPPCSGGAPAQDPDSPPYASPMAYRAVPVHERGWVG
jgi:hypothetical protein